MSTLGSEEESTPRSVSFHLPVETSKEENGRHYERSNTTQSEPPDLISLVESPSYDELSLFFPFLFLFFFLTYGGYI